MNRKQYIFGNWKMNNNLSATKEFFQKAESMLEGKDQSQVQMGIGVPFINILEAKKLAKNILIAAQNVHHEDSGAFTGEISVNMLKDIGIEYCIVGHSERREHFKENDNFINQKVIKLLANNINPILCVGETEEEYNKGSTASVVTNQIGKALQSIDNQKVQKIIVAYEPIWAIGTGKTATPQIAQDTIKIIREKLESIYGRDVASMISILYGGSVKADNIKEIMAQKDIDGALVGGASLTVDSFIDLFDNK